MPDTSLFSGTRVLASASALRLFLSRLPNCPGNLCPVLADAGPFGVQRLAGTLQLFAYRHQASRKIVSLILAALASFPEAIPTA